MPRKADGGQICALIRFVGCWVGGVGATRAASNATRGSSMCAMPSNDHAVCDG